jgi:4-hydroxybenzoate polyprenyltransferase
VSGETAETNRRGELAPGELLRALRPQQWIKNVLLFVPVLLAHRGFDAGQLFAVGGGFAAFCLAASAGYVLNDLLDREADRRHPHKRGRPFASGALSAGHGVALAASLVAAAAAISWTAVGAAFCAMLGLYLALTAAYSLYFKEKLFLDVLLLAGLYTHRVLSGAVAAAVPISPWLLGFSLFFFLSLAFAKRYCELRLSDLADPGAALPRRDYRREDLGLIQTLGSVSGYLSVLVLALYITSSDVVKLYATPALLWMVCPVLLYWLTRIWFLAGRGELPDDPVLFAASDPQSWAAGALILATGFLATL